MLGIGEVDHDLGVVVLALRVPMATLVGSGQTTSTPKELRPMYGNEHT
jgi:hypothetical protein